MQRLTAECHLRSSLYDCAVRARQFGLCRDLLLIQIIHLANLIGMISLGRGIKQKGGTSLIPWYQHVLHGPVINAGRS